MPPPSPRVGVATYTHACTHAPAPAAAPATAHRRRMALPKAAAHLQAEPHTPGHRAQHKGHQAIKGLRCATHGAPHATCHMPQAVLRPFSDGGIQRQHSPTATSPTRPSCWNTRSVVAVLRGTQHTAQSTGGWPGGSLQQIGRQRAARAPVAVNTSEAAAPPPHPTPPQGGPTQHGRYACRVCTALHALRRSLLPRPPPHTHTHTTGRAQPIAAMARASHARSAAQRSAHARMSMRMRSMCSLTLPAARVPAWPPAARWPRWGVRG